MGKSSKEKINYAVELLKQGKTYREIQKELKTQFGSTMSFSTLQKLNQVQEKVIGENSRIQELEQELALFKRLYFELLKKYDSLHEQEDNQNGKSKKTK
ncbi:hypothetical protein NEF87_000624 [Candidatus Lokiarchaeum ossiferum]|uniref:Transposase n=1 Tax=Candidatus Lokiarchaeum ossiferum TaxID=2951803 RepID=A0ABY6HPE8_9ARCH|nr:hypothetical protein NEF87_000624 [Candidatus Lokiarchaeum sp. B-35]